MSNLKIIFLDIDGVLNCEMESDNISLRCIRHLNQLIEITNAKIIITSTWRINKDIKTLQDILNQYEFKGEIIGLTPDLITQYVVRGNEIHKWLCDNEKLLNCSIYDYKNYVIFDDDNDMLLSQKNNFIHVDRYIGLTPTDIFNAEKILNQN